MGRQRMQNAALIFMSVLLSLAAETMLRWLKSDRKKYFVWQPNLIHTFYPDSTLFHGIKGASLFSINAVVSAGRCLRMATSDSCV